MTARASRWSDGAALAVAAIQACLLFGGALLAGAAMAAPGPAEGGSPAGTFTLKLPTEQKVVFRGLANFDAAGVGSAQMLYPAPNAAGLLVAILTHGAVVESAKNSQRTQMQEAADKVLDAYKADLSDFNHGHLLQRGLEQQALLGRHRHVDADGPDEAQWQVESAPVFSLGQDQSVLILDNTVTVRAQDDPQKVLHQTVVKVVWNLRDQAAPADYWAPAQAGRLKQASALLFAHSLGLVLDHVIVRQPPPADAPQKTYRYAEGKAERMERGSLVATQCDRVVIKNLRGWLMSIPMQPAADAAAQAVSCSDALAPA